MRRSRMKVWLVGGALSMGVLTLAAAAPEVEWGEAEAAELPASVAVVEEVPKEAPVEVVEALDVVEALELVASLEVVEAGAGDDAAPTADVVLETQVGSASYYANMLAGRRTASGVRYDPSAAVAAHRELPFGTRLRVENLANGRVVEVEVVDRGPFAKGRILDLSRSAARELDFIRQGHTRVRIEVLEYGGSRGG